MKVTLIMFKGGQRREFHLSGEKTVVGRRQDCGLRVPTRDVSRQHCEIVLEKGALVVRDLGSTNGTYVNNKRVAEAKLSAGDHLAVGPVEFVVQIDGKPEKIEFPVAPARPAERPTPAPSSAADEVDTEEILDLDELDLDVEEPISAVEAVLDEDEEDDETGKKK